MVLGAQLFTVRDFTQTKKDFQIAISEIAKIGYKGIQVSGIGDFSKEYIREIADFHNVEIWVTHSDPERILKKTHEIIREHEILRCRHVGISSKPSWYDNSPEGYRDFVRDFNKAAKILKENGMKLHYHNHFFEFERFNGKTGFDILLRECDPELWGFILDTYWVQAGGLCPEDMIRKLEDRIDFIHFKDMRIKDGRQLMAPVMEGNLNWVKIKEACEYAGVKYILVEQDTDFTDPFVALRTSYNNLMQLFPEEDCCK